MRRIISRPRSPSAPLDSLNTIREGAPCVAIRCLSFTSCRANSSWRWSSLASWPERPAPPHPAAGTGGALPPPPGGARRPGVGVWMATKHPRDQPMPATGGARVLTDRRPVDRVYVSTAVALPGQTRQFECTFHDIADIAPGPGRPGTGCSPSDRLRSVVSIRRSGVWSGRRSSAATDYPCRGRFSPPVLLQAGTTRRRWRLAVPGSTASIRRWGHTQPAIPRLSVVSTPSAGAAIAPQGVSLVPAADAADVNADSITSWRSSLTTTRSG